MNEIVPGLWHWTTLHPNIGQEVSSHLVRRSRAVLDPMVPGEGMVALDALPSPEHVVLSCRHHDRDHAEFVRAYGAELHVPADGVHEYPGEDLTPYAVGDEVVPGIAAVAGGRIAPDDMILHLDVSGGALLFADSLINPGGRLGFVPDQLLGDDPEQVRRDIADAVRGVLGLEFEHVLFAHGDPIVGDGRAALERFLEGEA